jgi:hypothetical protein
MAALPTRLRGGVRGVGDIPQLDHTEAIAAGQYVSAGADRQRLGGGAGAGLGLAQGAGVCRVAAHALAHLKGDEPLAGWATSASPALRLVAAERLPPTLGGALNPLLGKLTHDHDRAVAVAAVRNVADARTTEAAEQLKNVASTPREDWTCQHCGCPESG